MRKIFPNALIYVGFDSEGTIILNVQLRITDLETGLPVVMNVVGELCVKVPYIMNGYYKDPTQTQLAFDDEADDAYYDENGDIVFVGRLKEMIKYRGPRFYAIPVEQMLLSHPSKATTEDVLNLTCDLNFQRLGYIYRIYASMDKRKN